MLMNKDWIGWQELFIDGLDISVYSKISKKDAIKYGRSRIGDETISDEIALDYLIVNYQAIETGPPDKSWGITENAGERKEEI